MTYGLIAFAAVFLIVGVLRVVEINASGIEKKWLVVLIPLHVLGSALFSAAIVFLAIDAHGEWKLWTSACFFAGIIILFPLHIFLALKRRIRMSK